MSFNNVDALAEAYDAVFALFDRLRECAAVDRRDGHRGCFGGDYKDSSVVGIALSDALTLPSTEEVVGVTTWSTPFMV